MKPRGYYVIEDVHTSLVDRYTGFDAASDEANTKLTMIHGFIRHGVIRSQYLQPEEIDYLNSQIDYVNLWVRNSTAHSMTCIVKRTEIDVATTDCLWPEHSQLHDP